jgi:hypothetical protein
MGRYNCESKIKCTVCSPITNSSSGMELELYNYIKSIYPGKIIRNTKRILPSKKELDIYLPEINMAFEFNGMYWHSIERVPEDYHYNKTTECENLNLDLIQVFENVWLEKKDIIKEFIYDRIYTKTIAGTELNFKFIDIYSANKFYEFKHLSGRIDNDLDKIKTIAVYNNDAIISMLSYCDNEIVRIYNDNYLNLILNFIGDNNFEMVLNRLYYNKVSIKKYGNNKCSIRKYDNKKVNHLNKSKQYLIYNAGYIKIKI